MVRGAAGGQSPAASRLNSATRQRNRATGHFRPSNCGIWRFARVKSYDADVALLRRAIRAYFPEIGALLRRLVAEAVYLDR